MCALYNRIMTLCEEKGVSGSRVCLDIGVSKSTLSDIKAGRKKSMAAETIQKFATYFGVTVDYLLGNKTENTPTTDSKGDILDEVDVAFYGDYKELSEDDKATLRDMARIMRERRSKKQEQ